MFKIENSPVPIKKPKIVSIRECKNGVVDVLVDSFVLFTFMEDRCNIVRSGFEYTGVKLQ